MEEDQNQLVVVVQELTSLIVYPGTSIYYSPPYTKTILQCLKDNLPCICLVKKPGEGKDKYSDTGILCSLRKEDEKYYLDGKYRAHVHTLTLDTKTGLYKAGISELIDDPLLPELTGDKLSMAKACVQTIYVLLCRLEERITEKRLLDKVVTFKQKVYSSLREGAYAYSIAWDFLFYIEYTSKDDREEILKIDNLQYRLQRIIDLLHEEIRISNYVSGLITSKVPLQIRSSKKQRGNKAPLLFLHRPEIHII